MQDFEVAIIGGGIVGACVFSELTRKGVSAVLLEGASDVSNGSTKANSGIVHAGYDPLPNTLKARFNIRGNQLYPAMCARLKVDILQCGTLVVANANDRAGLETLYNRGLQNGVQGMRIIERDELHQMEPNLADNIDIGLFAPTGAVISPYLVCIALCEEGVVNGGTVFTNFFVDRIEKSSEKYKIFARANTTQQESSANDGMHSTTENDGTMHIKNAENCEKMQKNNENRCVTAKYIVNCAGVGANAINALVGAPQVPISYVKGEYLLLDKSQKGFVNRPIFPLPTKMGKGILALPTLHGNIMLGPTAQPCEADDTTVDDEGIKAIKSKVVLSVKQPNYKKVIKLFAGVRVISGDDFVIEHMPNTHYFYTAGICSPGLTAAPAIAEYLVDEMAKDGIKFKPHEVVSRKPYVCNTEMRKKRVKE